MYVRTYDIHVQKFLLIAEEGLWTEVFYIVNMRLCMCNCTNV